MTEPAPRRDADPTAVVGRRFGAVAIDLGILWVFSATYWLLASQPAPDRLSAFLEPSPSLTSSSFDVCDGRSFCTSLNDRYVAGGAMFVLVLVWIAYLFGVFVVQRGLTGRTVGTMLTGVAVVGADGKPVGVRRALGRSIAGAIDYLPCCLPLVGLVTVLVNPGHRRVGDMAAESYVVGNDHVGRPVQLPGPVVEEPPAPPPPDRIPARPPIPPSGAPPERPATPFASPAPTPPPTGAPVTGAGAGAADGGPVWDADRRAYLQWDPARRQWLQFDQANGRWQQYDAAEGRWRPLDG